MRQGSKIELRFEPILFQSDACAGTLVQTLAPRIRRKTVKMRLRNQHGNLALFCGQLALGLMQTTFMFYYVKVFLNVFHVNEYWFNVAQVLFMIWNAINDPLFGYIQVGEANSMNCE